MSYLRAEEILPKELVELIQRYVEGKCIYIPSKKKKLWGSNTDTKQFLDCRNESIYKEYQAGDSAKDIAVKYSLSVKSIQRIVRECKNMRNDVIYYHVVSDVPKQKGEHIILDEKHPNRVHMRVYEQMDAVKDIYANPRKYEGQELPYPVVVALRELALEKVRKEKYPRYPSRMASLYVSESFEEAEHWGDYFAKLGRPTYGIAKIKVNGNVYVGDAYKCFDGTVSEEENLRMAEIYWENGENEDGKRPIVEILVDGDIEIVDIVKVINANI